MRTNFDEHKFISLIGIYCVKIRQIQYNTVKTIDTSKLVRTILDSCKTIQCTCVHKSIGFIQVHAGCGFVKMIHSIAHFGCILRRLKFARATYQRNA